MLLEFRVTNYRSFQSEQILNLVATRDDFRLESNCLATGLPGLPFALGTALVYGANASGKSNLVQAMAFFQRTVRDSASRMQEGDGFEFSPFLFSSEEDPRATFEVVFLEEGVRHQYGFALNRERILEEWLLVYRKSKPQQWLQRTWDAEAGEDRYEFSSHLAGERKLWQKSTRSNALFLSTAVQLNSQMLRPVYQWIAERWSIFETGTISPFDTIQLLESEEGKKKLLDFLGAADLGIANARVTRRPLDQEILPPRLKDLLQLAGEVPEAVTIELEHQVTLENGEQLSRSLSLIEESLGTRRMFNLAAPVLRVLEQGGLLVIDELDRSLHPLLTRFLVELFQRPGSKAQLVFTTHNTSLIDLKQLLRRDQVYFVEKHRDLSTRIFPLSEFKVRKDDPVEKQYLQGRLGAVPIL